MPFPFLPGGAILGLAVLVGALTAFGLTLRAMDRALDGFRVSVLPGIISGLRQWTPVAARPPAQPSAARPGHPEDVEIVDLAGIAAPPA